MCTSLYLISYALSDTFVQVYPPFPIPEFFLASSYMSSNLRHNLICSFSASCFAMLLLLASLSSCSRYLSTIHNLLLASVLDRHVNWYGCCICSMPKLDAARELSSHRPWEEKLSDTLALDLLEFSHLTQCERSHGPTHFGLGKVR